MKKAYTRPSIEFETYNLSDSIAANCHEIINLGPGGVDGYDTCSDYGPGDIWGVSITTFRVVEQSFYEGVCSCYYSAGGEGYFTS